LSQGTDAASARNVDATTGCAAQWPTRPCYFYYALTSALLVQTPSCHGSGKPYVLSCTPYCV
jgi:hypothetical protein